jgi:SAM-dependent methyltransferase
MMPRFPIGPESDFYKEYASEATSGGLPVLELTCGTGRVALKLARAGHEVVGPDRAPAMPEAAHLKSDGLKNARWIEDDMRSFNLGQVFGFIIIPGHSFQNLLTAADQITCLRSIKRHLAPAGRLVMHLDHQDVDWLGALMGAAGGVFEPAEEFAHPKTGGQVKTSRAWWYERSAQTAIVQTI